MDTAKKRRRVRRTGVVLATFAVAGASLIAAAPAGAVKPSTQACIGRFMSGQATTVDPPTHGKMMSDLARNGGPLPSSFGPGAGDSIQNLQAGLVPDTVIDNTCNDA